MNQLTTLLKREFWEHRAIAVTPVVVGVLIIAGLILPLLTGTMGDVHVDGMSGAFDELSAEKVDAIWAVAGAGIAFPFALAMLLVTIFYLLDCLYAERKDRSILFWKSLPVSDALVVLSKLLTAVVVIPLVTFVVLTVTSILAWAVSAGFIRSLGSEASILAAGSGNIFQGLLLAGYLLFVQALWYLPVYGWLLLVSAYANRALLLWATLPPLAVIWMESALFGTNRFGDLLGRRLVGFFDASLNHETITEVDHLSDGDTDISVHATAEIGELLDPLGYLTTPGLWAGVLVAALFLAGAVWLRRYRDEAQA